MPGIFGGTGGGGTFVPIQMTYFVDLPHFPDWAVPMTKLITKVYTDDGWDTSKVGWGGNTRHWWNKVAENHWQIRVELYASVSYTLNGVGIILPTYVDVDLVIVNERVWHEVNPNKS